MASMPLTIYFLRANQRQPLSNSTRLSAYLELVKGPVHLKEKRESDGQRLYAARVKVGQHDLEEPVAFVGQVDARHLVLGRADLEHVAEDGRVGHQVQLVHLELDATMHHIVGRECGAEVEETMEGRTDSFETRMASASALLKLGDTCGKGVHGSYGSSMLCMVVECECTRSSVERAGQRVALPLSRHGWGYSRERVEERGPSGIARRATIIRRRTRFGSAVRQSVAVQARRWHGGERDEVARGSSVEYRSSGRQVVELQTREERWRV